MPSSTVIVRPGSGGIVAIYNSSAGPIDVRVDAVGWMQPGKNEADVVNVVPLVHHASHAGRVRPDRHDRPHRARLDTGRAGQRDRPSANRGTAQGPDRDRRDDGASRGDMVVTTTPGTIANVIPTFDIGVSPDWPGNVTPDPEHRTGRRPRTAPDRLLAEAVAGQAPQVTAPDVTNDWDCGSDFDIHTSYQAILGNLRITGGVRLPLSQSSFSMTVSPDDHRPHRPHRPVPHLQLRHQRAYRPAAQALLRHPDTRWLHPVLDRPVGQISAPRRRSRPRHRHQRRSTSVVRERLASPSPPAGRRHSPTRPSRRRSPSILRRGPGSRAASG